MDRSDLTWPSFTLILAALFVLSGIVFVFIGLANGSGACK